MVCWLKSGVLMEVLNNARHYSITSSNLTYILYMDNPPVVDNFHLKPIGLRLYTIVRIAMTCYDYMSIYYYM
jgi:hypothetical protein